MDRATGNSHVQARAARQGPDALRGPDQAPQSSEERVPDGSTSETPTDRPQRDVEASLEPSNNGSTQREMDVETTGRSAEFVPQAPDRFRQYVMQIGERASTDERRIMAFGFYLWNYEKQERFTGEEIKGFFRALHLPAPDELDATLDDLTARKRWLEADAHETDEAGWSLTAKGVNYVKNRLPHRNLAPWANTQRFGFGPP